MVISTSRSACTTPRLPELLAHHGEKSRATSPLGILNDFGVIDADLSTLLCVNPYDVNPLIGWQRQTAPQNSSAVNNCLKREEDASRIGDGLQTKYTVEMEVFKDLTPFLPTTAASCTQNVADELNTPVLDRKEGFDFTEYASISTQQSESSFNCKIKNEPSELHAINVNNNKYSVVFKEDQTNNNGINIMNESDMFMNLNQQRGSSSSSSTMLFSPARSSDVTDEYYYPSVKENPTTIDDDVFTTITMEDIMLNLNNNNPQDSIDNISKDKQDYEYDTPEDSNNSSILSTSTNKLPTKPLKLDFSTKFFENADTLSTPDVIKVISDYDKRFNILNIVNEEDIPTLSDQFQQNESTQSSESVFDFAAQSPPLDETVENKRHEKSLNKSSRKRKNSGSDEDYIPPIKKSCRTPKRRKSNYDTDSELEEEYTPKRGRPSKRYASTESDYSKDLDAQRYRELRDKNNEASRRSRLKRKMKEMSLEKEADELETKNIKLKAQVEQLENLVKNFRSNLFSIIVK